MSISRRGLLAVLAAVLFVAGCARSSTSASTPGSAPSSPGVAASSPHAPSPGDSSPGVSAPSVSAPRPVPPSAEAISGTVAAGVESNCLLLQGGGKPHLLIFADPAMKAKAKVGAMVTVVGTAKPAQMTICQQGTPFLVTSIRVDRPGA